MTDGHVGKGLLRGAARPGPSPSIVGLALLFLIGCSLSPPFPSSQPSHPDPPTHDRYLTIFLIDGLAQDVFTRELGQGRLPNIAAAIAGGAYVEKGITSFPSVSGYAYYPFLTGRTATESGVFGLRWFDRSRTEGNFRNYVGRTNALMNADLEGATEMLFEGFPADPTSAFNSIITRGATHTTTLGLDFLLSKYRAESTPVQVLNGAVQTFNAIPKLGVFDDVAANHGDLERRLIRGAIQGIDDGDKIQFIVFTTLDNINHLEGYRTDDGFNAAYVEQLLLVDELIGEYRRRSTENGTEDKRVYLITSDHGINRITRNISVVDRLQTDFGLLYDRDTAVRRSGGLDRPLTEYLEGGVDVIQALQGNNMCFLYFNNPSFVGPDSWHRPLAYDDLRSYARRGGTDTVDLVRAVSSMEGVELVIHRGPAPGRFSISTLHGAGEITVEGPETFSYRVTSGVDPLGYAGVPWGVPIHEDEWLKLTFDTRYPYAVPLLARLLTSHRDADLVVTAKDGYDHGLDFEFVVQNYRGGHGGLDEGQMVVPFILTGPGVRVGVRVPFARAEDVGNTLQKLMGLAPARPERVLADVIGAR